jgi:hypothetical protein
MRRVIEPGASGKLYWTNVVENPLVSIRVGTRAARDAIYAAIRDTFAEEQRYLLINVQGDGELPCWQISVKWGPQPSSATRTIYLAHNQHDPESIIRVIGEILESEVFCVSSQPAEKIELTGSVLKYVNPFEPVRADDSTHK